MKTIGVVCCFFGKWPKWAHLFMESCRHNPTIDFFLVTDCAIPARHSARSIRVVDFNLQRFNTLASEKLGIEVDVKRPYKLADFKPAYGVIFREYLERYDFWGYCDLDVIFGDIRSFLTDELLAKYDVIASRKEFITGHFTLFRNIDLVTHLYQRSKDYKNVFESEENFAFDECGVPIHFKLLRGEAFADVASEARVDSLMHVIERTPDIRVHRKTICDEHLPFKESFASIIKEVRWDNGRIVDVAKQRELMYYHLQELKRSVGFYVPHWDRMPEAFRITRRGVFWVGEQDLTRRLETAVRRKAYLIGNLARFYRWHLLRFLRRNWLLSRHP